ncbi:hypothetical protein FACS1894172_16640 [Spirochaetia bacterium]|nr:hypothetical protein FACS1894164_00860 [Spirochaetia bacterium]GHU35202.1 hypothetical protein FACS1894172_16640 [Spirochaetia bacterium]
MRHIFFSSCALLFCFSICFAVGADVNVSIRYFDKRVYYVQGAINEPVLIHMTITNDSPEVFHFRFADERAFSINFEVRTRTNRLLDPADVLMRKRETIQQVFFREVVLEPGESFSFVEDIRNYVNLNQTGSFIVRAQLYPRLYGKNTSTLDSNLLNLNLMLPSILGPDGIPLDMNLATNAILVREKLPPDQVVDFMLRARQQGQWERFFLYLDLEAMLRRNDAWQRQWERESQEGQQRLLIRYREDLQNSTIDGIAMIPTDFKIERTTYSTTEGRVEVLESFQTGMLVEQRYYTYFLTRSDDIWTIVDYTVTNRRMD